MQFTKNDMVVQHYDWDPIQEEAVASQDDGNKKIFNRKNGWTVLDMINRVLDDIGASCSISAGRNLELLILTDLPAEVNADGEVFDWLVISSNRRNTK